MSDANLSFAFKLPPKEAIKYFQSKGNAISWNWYEVWQEAHAKVFTVAKVTKLDILLDIRNAVEKAIRDGTTLQQFKKDLVPKLIDQGWWGKDKDTGAQLGSPSRLKKIFEININVAHSAGRYNQMMDNKDFRPWWKYMAIEDNRTRKSHLKLNELVLKFDDPFWISFYPPIDWLCRCKVMALSDRNLERENITPISSEGKLRTENRLISKKSGEMKPVTIFTNPRTGLKTATGIGWNYNPGKAWKADLGKYPNDLGMLFEKDGTYNINPKFKDKIDMEIGRINNTLTKWKNWTPSVKEYVYNIPYDKFYETWEEGSGEKRKPGQEILAFYSHKKRTVYIRNDIAMDIATGNETKKQIALHAITHDTMHSIIPQNYYLSFSKNNKKEEFSKAKKLGEAVTEILSKIYMVKFENINPDNPHLLRFYHKESGNLLLNILKKADLKQIQIEEELYKFRTGEISGIEGIDLDIQVNINLLQKLEKGGIISFKEYLSIKEEKRERYLRGKVLQWLLEKKN